MTDKNNLLELDSDDISLINDAVSLMPTNAELPSWIESEGLEDPCIAHATSIKEKLALETAPFSGGEVQFIYWALRNYLDLLNKRKAVARKGTALYKRTHYDLKIINALLSKFIAFDSSGV